MTTLEQMIETAKTLLPADRQQLQQWLQAQEQQDTATPVPEAQPHQETEQERPQERLDAVASAREAKLRQELDEYRRAKQWIAEHRAEYLNQWVVLEGDRLISHGANAKQVYDDAKDAGIQIPFVVQIIEEPAHYIGGFEICR